MRRDPTADNGLVELMVASLAERSAQFGVGSGVDELRRSSARRSSAAPRSAPDRSPRLWRQALLLASRNWQLESLYRSNAKYLPSWQPRFMCFEYASDLPRVGTAAGSAEGFLTRPSLSSLLNRKESGAPAALETGTAEYAAEVRALMPPEPDLLAEALSADKLPEQVRVRRAKVNRLKARGIEPYPVGYPRSTPSPRYGPRPACWPPDARTGRDGLDHRSGAAEAEARRDRFRAPCGTAPATCRCWSRATGSATSCSTCGSTTSTSATTSGSPAR